MHLVPYAIITVLCISAGVVVWTDMRSRRLTAKAVNEFLGSAPCPACGGQFRAWRGEQSKNHYQFDDGQEPGVFAATCSRCGDTVDLFHFSDDAMELPPMR